MELDEVLRTTASVRQFTDRPVPRAEIEALLEVARFASSGGNRQPWHVVSVEDRRTRRELARLAQKTWNEYRAIEQAGLTPFAAGVDGLPAVSPVDAESARTTHSPNPMLEGLEDAPAVLVVLADLMRVAAMDIDLERPGFVGGASVYPFVWSLLLAARGRGLGGVLTTYLARQEPQVRALLGFPEHVGVAAMVVLGEPVRQLTKLRRRPVSAFLSIDRWSPPPE
jgi:nitroreductase